MFLYILLSNCLNVYFFSCINLFTSQNQQLDEVITILRVYTFFGTP